MHAIKSITFQSSIGFKGNPSYSSPELLELGEYSKNSDVYAFSLIVYELMTLEVPFKDVTNINGLYKEVVKRGKRPQIKDDVAKPYRHLIESCWAQNPNERPSFRDIESILKKDKSFITKKVDPKAFYKYIKIIELSSKEFDSNNRIVRYDNIIQDEQNNTDKTKYSKSKHSSRKNTQKKKR